MNANLSRSVMALCNLYNLHDPRISQVHVKGDLVVNQNTSGRIMTRSRARQNPDQYTIIPASLKMIKVLVQELLIDGPEINHQQLDAAAAADLEEEDSEDDDWEDDDNFLDLGSGMTKEQLMAFAADDGPSRDRGFDDKTQAGLAQFFRAQAARPEFAEVFNALTSEEQDKLRNMGG